MVNWDYLAGFIDGEGSLTLTKKGNNYYPCVTFANTDYEVIDKLAEFLKLDRYVYAVKYKISPLKKKQCYVFKANRADQCEYILSHIQDKLITKKSQARLIMSYIKDKKSGDLDLDRVEEYVRLIRIMNKRGKE